MAGQKSHLFQWYCRRYLFKISYAYNFPEGWLLHNGCQRRRTLSRYETMYLSENWNVFVIKILKWIFILQKLFFGLIFYFGTTAGGICCQRRSTLFRKWNQHLVSMRLGHIQFKIKTNICFKFYKYILNFDKYFSKCNFCWWNILPEEKDPETWTDTSKNLDKYFFE